MAKTDPSLGFSVDFDAEGFRRAIHFAMEMGAPPDPSLRATFVFPSTGRTYTSRNGDILDPASVRTDRDGRPLDPTIRVTDTPGARIQVDCAVEIVRADADELPVGNFRPTKAVVTLLDEEHDQVKGCRELIYNGDRYLFGYEPDALGLFDVGTFTMIFYAVDET